MKLVTVLAFLAAPFAMLGAVTAFVCIAFYAGYRMACLKLNAIFKE